MCSECDKATSNCSDPRGMIKLLDSRVEMVHVEHSSSGQQCKCNS